MSKSLYYERQKRALLVVLGLVFVLSIYICISVETWNAKPQLPMPTSTLSSVEKMEKSAYDACAKQFVPPPKEQTFFPIEAWSIVPWPKNGYYIGDPSLASSSHLPAVYKEDSIYHVHLFVDFTVVVTEKEPYTEKVTTTRSYGRGSLNCSAYYLGAENGIVHWDVKFWDSLRGTGDCIHSKYMDPDLSSYVFCDYY